jgi:hypothetical protein
MPTPAELTTVIAAIHATPARAVVAVTGGGASALAWLLAVPGASRTILEGMVPYAAASLEELAGPVSQAASTGTARAMASACLARARHLAGADREATVGELIGLGATAALASDRPKRGQHRAHVAVACAGGSPLEWTLVLDKGARDRGAEELVVARLIVDALAVASGAVPLGTAAGAPGDRVTPDWPRDPR